jgi:hypothetical protein
MRTQIILSLVALLAGLAPAKAQTDVVAYATVTFPSGFSLAVNPLSNGLTNGANEIGLLIDGEQIFTWNGSGFDTFAYDLTSNSWSDGASSLTVAPSLPPGRGFFFFNPGPSTNIVFEGRITPSPGSSNFITLATGYSLVGSLLPASLTNITTAPINLPLIDGMIILTWNGTGYNYSLFDSGLGGWTDVNVQPTLAPSYSLGQGFFIWNPGPPVAWVQSLPYQDVHSSSFSSSSSSSIH